MGGQDGLDGLNGLNGVDALATGGLVGEDGIAGTGLLANTGDPSNIDPTLANLLTTTGGAVGGVADGTDQLASAIDGGLPGDVGVLGAVTGTLDDTGQALTDAGNGNGYLVDGLTGATNDLATLSLGEGAVLGNSSDSSLVGVSLLSPEQDQGDLLTVGVGSGGENLTVETPLLGNSGDGSAGDLLNLPVGDVTDGLLGSGGGSGQTTGGNLVQDTVQGATGLLGGLSGN